MAGYFPKQWKSAEIIILKPNKDRKLPFSYRPISLLNVIGKTYEKNLENRLQIFLQDNSLIPEAQLGFRPD